MTKKLWGVTFEIYLDQSAETSEEALDKARRELDVLLEAGLYANDFLFTEPVCLGEDEDN